jgi:hypothetical protein
MTSPEVPTRQGITPELRDKIARRVAEKAFKLASSTMPSAETTIPRVFQYDITSLKPTYIGPERFTDTDFSEIKKSALLSPISRDPSDITTINSYVSMINDGAPLSAEQYKQVQNRLLEMQTKGLIARTPMGLYRIPPTEQE